MAITLTNPDHLPVVPLYHHISVATGTSIVHLAGQVSWDAEGALIGDGDLAAQVQQCLLNIAGALTAVGAGMKDLVDLTAYFIDVTPETAAAYQRGAASASARLGEAIPAVPFTGVGVAALAGPGLLVELKATAVLP